MALNSNSAATTPTASSIEILLSRVKTAAGLSAPLGLALSFTYEVGFYEALGLEPIGSNIWVIPVPLIEYLRIAIGFALIFIISVILLSIIVGPIVVIAGKWFPSISDIATPLARDEIPAQILRDWVARLERDRGVIKASLWIVIAFLVALCLVVFVIGPALEMLVLWLGNPVGLLSTVAFVALPIASILLLGTLWFKYGYIQKWWIGAILLLLPITGVISLGGVHGTWLAQDAERSRFWNLTQVTQSCLGQSKGVLLRSYSNGTLLLTLDQKLVWLPVDSKSPCWVTQLRKSQIRNTLVTPTIFGSPVDLLAFTYTRVSRIE